MSIALRRVHRAHTSNSRAARTRRPLAGALIALALAAAACSSDVATSPPSLAKQSALSGSFALSTIDGQTPSSVLLCGGTVAVSEGALVLQPTGAFTLTFTTTAAQTYQETGTYKLEPNGTITFKTAGQTAQGEYLKPNLVVSYTYCGETHSLLFVPAAAA